MQNISEWESTIYKGLKKKHYTYLLIQKLHLEVIEKDTSTQIQKPPTTLEIKKALRILYDLTYHLYYHTGQFCNQ